MNPVGETGRAPLHGVGAEGATAPETLRQTDRVVMKLWKAGGRFVAAASPKG
jgi:hypothetical protein